MALKLNASFKGLFRVSCLVDFRCSFPARGLFFSVSVGVKLYFFFCGDGAHFSISTAVGRRTDSIIFGPILIQLSFTVGIESSSSESFSLTLSGLFYCNGNTFRSILTKLILWLESFSKYYIADMYSRPNGSI